MIHYIINTKKDKTVPSVKVLTVCGEENKQYIKWSKRGYFLLYLYFCNLEYKHGKDTAGSLKSKKNYCCKYFNEILF